MSRIWKKLAEFVTQNSLTLRDVWKNTIPRILSQPPIPAQPIDPLPPLALAQAQNPPRLLQKLSSVILMGIGGIGKWLRKLSGPIVILMGIGGIGKWLSVKCLTRVSTYKVGYGELLIRDGGSILVGVVTDLIAADMIIMLNGVDFAVNDAGRRVITLAASRYRDSFILTILDANGIHIVLRGQYQCMKAALRNGILTPVSIGLWEGAGLCMICSNQVENEDVFAVAGSSFLWEIFEPIEIITLVKKQKRKEAAQSLAEEAIRRANMTNILNLYVAIIFFK